MKQAIKPVSVLICILIAAAGVFAGNPVEVKGADALDPKAMLYQNGNQIVDGYGRGIRLMGVNVPELGWDTITSILDRTETTVEATFNRAMAMGNAVRLAIRPAYWNNGVFQSAGSSVIHTSKEDYRALVDKLIARASAKGIYVVLDNHSFYGVLQDSMNFWNNAAARYKDHPYVIFGLFNEPVTDSWEKWKNGGYMKFNGKNDWGKEEVFEGECVGQQQLLTHLRKTGAKNLVTVSGNTWGYDLTEVTTNYRLEDAPNTNGMIYETHIYPGRDPDYETCVGVAAREYPILVGECGPMFHEGGQAIYHTDLRDEGAKGYMQNLLDFMDKYEINLTAWSLGSQPSLTDTGGALNAYGQMIDAYIQKVLKEKNVSLYTETYHRGDPVSLNTGLYTSQELGFDIKNLLSVKTKTSAYQYAIILMENPDGSGKTFSIANRASNIGAYNIDFTPKALLIQRVFPQNVLSKNTTSFSGDFENKGEISNIVDGTMSVWEGERDGPQTIILEMNKTYMLTSIIIDHAGAAGAIEVHNTREFSIALSDNGKVYTRVATVRNNTMSQTQHQFDPFIAKYIKIIITAGSLSSPENASLVNVTAFGADYLGGLSQLPGKISYGKPTVSSISSSRAASVAVAEVSSEEASSEPESSVVSEEPREEESSRASVQKSEPVWVEGEVNWPLTIGLIAGGAVLLGAAVLVYIFIIRKKFGK